MPEHAEPSAVHTGRRRRRVGIGSRGPANAADRSGTGEQYGDQTRNFRHHDLGLPPKRRTRQQRRRWRCCRVRGLRIQLWDCGLARINPQSGIRRRGRIRGLRQDRPRPTHRRARCLPTVPRSPSAPPWTGPGISPEAPSGVTTSHAVPSGLVHGGGGPGSPQRSGRARWRLPKRPRRAMASGFSISRSCKIGYPRPRNF